MPSATNIETPVIDVNHVATKFLDRLSCMRTSGLFHSAGRNLRDCGRQRVRQDDVVARDHRPDHTFIGNDTAVRHRQPAIGSG